MTTTLGCVSIPGCRVPLSVLESLSFSASLPDDLVDLRDRAGASAVFVLSTCERVEVYACWRQPPEPGALVNALALNRGQPVALVHEAATQLVGAEAAHHLLRVTSGLESFVLGERDIVGQVRAAAEASRAAGTTGAELERLLATAINTSRRVHRDTDLAGSARSVATTAVGLAASANGGDLENRRVLVVGSGHVGTQVTESATRLGASVTVCNRTRRHAERLTAAGATVVDLARLLDVLALSDVAIFGTAAPHPLFRAEQLARLPRAGETERLVIDLCVPRNVDPDVRLLPGVRLVDLADLHRDAVGSEDRLSLDVTVAERIIDTELHGYHSWLAARTAAASVRRLRADLEQAARRSIEDTLRDVPEDARPVVAAAIRRAFRQLAHAPTKRLLRAAEEGDEQLVAALATLYANDCRLAPSCG